MSWAWNFLADLLWIPVVAYLSDLGYDSSHEATLFALNLGSRLLPNAAVALLGMKSELLCMACVLGGTATALFFPGRLWAVYVMAFCLGMGFVRACLTLHPAMVFQDASQLARAAKYCGAARNLGTLTALVVPVAAYNRFGWAGVCALAGGATLLYMGLALVQYALYGGKAAAAAKSEGEADLESPRSAEAQAGQPIPWILWLMGGAFVMLELQVNICNAAVPSAMEGFGLDLARAGHFMAASNGISMVFLAWLPSAPKCLSALHRSPLNMVLTYASICVAWCLAVVSTGYGGLALFLPGVLLFMLSAYLAQCLLLECLTGILDLEASKLLMAVAETLGCACAALGAYAGGRLRAYGAAAPFALQAATAGFVGAVLALALGHRLAAQLGNGPKGKSWLRKSLAGLRAMAANERSFLDLEREYLRGQTAEARRPDLKKAESFGSSTATPEEAASEEPPSRQASTAPPVARAPQFP